MSANIAGLSLAFGLPIVLALVGAITQINALAIVLLVGAVMAFSVAERFRP